VVGNRQVLTFMSFFDLLILNIHIIMKQNSLSDCLSNKKHEIWFRLLIICPIRNKIRVRRAIRLFKLLIIC